VRAPFPTPMFSRRLRTFLVSCLALAPLAACGGARQSRPSTAERTFIEVQNNSFSDMTIYIVEGSGRFRLGVASSASTTKLPIPSQIVGAGRELQFLADPLGSTRTSVSERIWVRPGDTVALTIVR
jgi:hypothetical protein